MEITEERAQCLASQQSGTRNRCQPRLLESAVGQGYSSPRTGTSGCGSNGWVGYNRRGYVRANSGSQSREWACSPGKRMKTAALGCPPVVDERIVEVLGRLPLLRNFGETVNLPTTIQM